MRKTFISNTTEYVNLDQLIYCHSIWNKSRRFRFCLEMQKKMNDGSGKVKNLRDKEYYVPSLSNSSPENQNLLASFGKYSKLLII